MLDLLNSLDEMIDDHMWKMNQNIDANTLGDMLQAIKHLRTLCESRGVIEMAYIMKRYVHERD
jgi:hypothetical protein